MAKMYHYIVSIYGMDKKNDKEITFLNSTKAHEYASDTFENENVFEVVVSEDIYDAEQLSVSSRELRKYTHAIFG